MSAVVQRRARRPPVPERPPSFNTSLTLVFEICSAGARPNNIAGQQADTGDEREHAAGPS